METKLSLEKDTLDALQDLMVANLDSAKTLKEAAEKIDHGAIENLFRGVAVARVGNAEELKSYLKVNAEKPVEDESTIGSEAHRQWMGLRAAINSGDPKVLLIETERAEDKIKGTYEQLLVDTAGSAMNDVLMGQYRQVKKHHDLIRDLRDSALAN